MFELRNISFAYNERPVLKDVSFLVSPGETVSILGANGAGKTTLLKVMATLAVPSSGQILSDGRNMLRNPLEFRRLIGYLPEKVALYEDMTVKEYLSYRAKLKGEAPKRLRRRVAEAVEFCRITELMRHAIGGLSAGVKKRVALADALMLRPRLLLLDDFMSGLDLEMRAQTADILASAASFSAVVATGHELSDMTPMTTRFLVLRNGAISASIPTVGIEPQQVRDRAIAALSGGDE